MSQFLRYSWIFLWIVLQCQAYQSVSENAVIPKVTDCDKLTSCSCRSSTLGVIDLSPLANDDGLPRFANVKAEPGKESYSWNPCKPFSVESCINVAVCQTIEFTSSSSYYNLGDQSSARFIVDDEIGLTLSYAANTYTRTSNGSLNHTFLRTSIIRLKCDPSAIPGEFTAQGEEQSRFGYYHFTLTSIYACPDKVLPSQQSGLSTGSWLLIFTFITVISYMGIGVAVQLFIRKKSGVEVIPNKDFWVTLPGYIKDGFWFVVKRGKAEPYIEFK